MSDKERQVNQAGWVQTAAGLLIAAGLAVSVASLAGFLGSLYWRFDLMTHFRLQYFLALAGVAMLLGLLCRFRWMLLFDLFALANFALVLPLFIGTAQTTGQGDEPALRAMLANVHTDNRHYEAVIGAIREYNPDLVLLEETSERWLEALSDLRHDYGYWLTCPRNDNFGIALLSKVNPERAEIEYVGEAKVPSVVAEFRTDRGAFTLVGTHPLPPASARYTALRNGQLAALPALLAGIKTPVLLLGDLNTTRWSHAFSPLIHEGHLQDSARGGGWAPTWPTWCPPLAIPIDHCLYSSGLQITGRRVGPNVGSDHRPLIVDFRLTPAQEVSSGSSGTAQ